MLEQKVFLFQKFSRINIFLNQLASFYTELDFINQLGGSESINHQGDSCPCMLFLTSYFQINDSISIRLFQCFSYINHIFDTPLIIFRYCFDTKNLFLSTETENLVFLRIDRHHLSFYADSRSSTKLHIPISLLLSNEIMKIVRMTFANEKKIKEVFYIPTLSR